MMDAYVFIRGAESGSISELRKVGDPRLRFITDLTGPEDIFVAIEANGLRDVRDAVVGSIRGVGLRDSDTSIAVRVPPQVDEETALATPHLPMGVRRWFTSRQVEAYSRVRVQRGHAREVYETVNQLDGYLGHALVAGRSDLIVAMGGDDFETVSGAVLEGLQNSDWVLSTQTSFAFNDGGSAF
jgi:hypothetical protein